MMSRGFLGGAAALGFVLAGATVAQAATFNFIYNGDGDGVSAMGTFAYDGSAVTGVSGTVNFAGNPNGSGSITNFIRSYSAGYISPTNYRFDFTANVGARPDQVEFYFGSGNDNAYLNDIDSGALSFGTSNVSTASAPAPIPGGGLLSFLALGVAGLAYRRKQIADVARASFRKLNTKAVASAG